MRKALWRCFQRHDKKWNCKRKRKDFKKTPKIYQNYRFWRFCFGLVLYCVSENGSQSQQVYSFILSPLQLYQSHRPQNLNQLGATHSFLGINHYQVSQAWPSPKHWAAACTNMHTNRIITSEKRKKHGILKRPQNLPDCNCLEIILPQYL